MSNIRNYHFAEVRKFVSCGDPKEGFALVECPECGESFFVSFSVTDMDGLMPMTHRMCGQASAKTRRRNGIKIYSNPQA